MRREWAAAKRTFLDVKHATRQSQQGVVSYMVERYFKGSQFARVTRPFREKHRPTACPKCGSRYSGDKTLGVPKIQLVGFQSGRPRFKCPACGLKFSGERMTEPRKVKHGRSRYNKTGCRCDICVAAMRKVAKAKYERRKERQRT